MIELRAIEFESEGEGVEDAQHADPRLVILCRAQWAWRVLQKPQQDKGRPRERVEVRLERPVGCVTET